MVNFIVSLLLGMFPEVLYFTLFMSYAKDKKEKRIKLFILLAIGYIILIMICRYQYIFYLAYIIYGFLILKWLYKSHISDIFIFSLSFSYVSLLSYIMYEFLGNNYYLAFIIDRILLFVPIIFKKYLRIFYVKYMLLWNKNDKSKIKSITLRNISLLLFNLMILLFNILSILSLVAYQKLG